MVTVVVAGVLASGCGDERGARAGGDAGGGGSARRSVEVAADADGLQGPGAPVADGVTVAEGSQLVSQAFPVSSFGEETGWSALFVVDGDPIAVWDEYVGTLGIADGDATRSCVVSAEARPPDETPSTRYPTTTASATDPRPADSAAATTLVPETSTSAPARAGAAPRRRFLTESRIEDEDRLTCSLVQGRSAMNLRVGVQLRCDDSGCRSRAISHLLVTQSIGDANGYSSRGTDDLRYERGVRTDESSPPVTAAIPDGPIQAPRFTGDGLESGLPSSGDRIDDGLDWYLPDTFTLPDGGRSLVAPAMLLPCNSGLATVVRVPFDPDGAIAWLDGAGPSDDAIVTTSGTRDGHPWVSGTISTAGGYYLYATAMPATGGRGSDVFITECGD